MNDYLAFYEGREIEIQADTSYKAQQAAVKAFRAPRSKAYRVQVFLVAKNGVPYSHSTAEV